MQYKYCEHDNFEDYASGRVLYSAEGVANFPLRLINEIFGYAKEYSVKKQDLCVYDPCCGGGYSLTVLGFMNADVIKRLCGSDVDTKMVEVAGKNLALLREDGLEKRSAEIKMHGGIATEVFVADCTEELPRLLPDIIITDVPYGNLVEWNTESNDPLYDMLQQLAGISHQDTVLAVSMGPSG